MQALKKASSFMGSSRGSSASTEVAATTAAQQTQGYPQQTQGPQNSKSQQSKGSFFQGSPEELQKRRMLVHQEAFVDHVERYADGMANVMNGLVQVHESLLTGLIYAYDLGDTNWAQEVDTFAKHLRRDSDSGCQQLKEVKRQIAVSKAEHREAVKLAREADLYNQKKAHYTQKVSKMRQEVEKMRKELGSTALDPDTPDAAAAAARAGKGSLQKAVDQKKTDNYDMKVGRLFRNEEKLRSIDTSFQSKRKEALGKLEKCVNDVRQKVRSQVQQVLNICLHQMLPSISRASQAAQAEAGNSSSDGQQARQQNSMPAEIEDGRVGDVTPGERVKITGLVGAPQFNGTEGVVKGLRPDGRVEVETVDPTSPRHESKVLALKTENLLRQPTHLSAFIDHGQGQLQLSYMEAQVQQDDSSDEG